MPRTPVNSVEKVVVAEKSPVQVNVVAVAVEPISKEEKKAAASKKKETDTSTFRESTFRAIAQLRSQNKKLTADAMSNKKKTIAANRKNKKAKRRKYVSDKYTKISGLQGLQGLQGLSPKTKKA